MKTNIGNLDRLMRVGIGLILVIPALLGEIGPWGYLGLIPLVTGAVGTCPLYTMLGISTCPASGPKAK